MKRIMVLCCFILIVTIGIRLAVVSHQYYNQEKQDKIEFDAAEAEYYRCRTNMKTERQDFDLINYYNYTCEKIKFIIDHWIKETNEEFVDDGLFGGYHYETKYYGVGNVKLTKSKIKKIQTAPNCTGWEQTTNIYLEKDFVNYYLNNCMVSS